MPGRAPARLAPWALMLGNFIMGVSVLAPAGMLPDLAQALDVAIRDAGLLMTYGAIALCFGAPLMSWATSRIDRRLLLAGVLGLLGLFNVLSALTPNYAVLVVLRIAMMIGGAVYTPQAASAVGLIVPEKARAQTISFVFLGWSLSVALGLPVITFLASVWGWRATFALVGLAGCAMSFAVLLIMPRGVFGAAVSFRTWGAVFSDRLIVLLLLTTTLMMIGQFSIFVYLGPLLMKFVGAGPDRIAAAFLVSGVMGLVGNLIASRVVGQLGAFVTTVIFLCAIFAGALVWSLGSGIYAIALVSVALFGLGLASTNSMQQGRLIAAAPTLASASVALNTSAIYVGQAVGSAMSALLFSAGHAELIGWVSMLILALAVVTLWLTRPARIR